MKKLFAVLLSLALALSITSVFAGCSNEDALRVINFRPEDEAFYTYLNDEFEKKYGVEVIYESVSTDAYPNLQQSRLQGNAIDVFGTQVSNIASESLVSYMAPLDDLKASDGVSLWDQIEEEAVSTVTIDGSRYIAPLGDVTIPVYYNKAVFSKLDPAPAQRFANGQYPTTWSEMSALLRDLQAMKNRKEIDDVIAFGGMESWPISMIVNAFEVPCVSAVDPYFYRELALSHEGYDFGHDLYRDNFEKMREFVSYIDDRSMGQSYAFAPSTFATTQTALMVDGSWSLPAVLTANPDMEIGFFPMPANDSAEYNIYVPKKAGSGFSIAKSSQKKDLAAKYIEMHYDPAIYQKYIDDCCIRPVLKGVEQTNATAKAMYVFPTKPEAESMWIPGLPGSTPLRSIAVGFQNGTVSVEDAIKTMNDQMNGNAAAWQKRSSLQPWLDRYFDGVERDEYAPE